MDKASVKVGTKVYLQNMEGYTDLGALPKSWRDEAALKSLNGKPFEIWGMTAEGIPIVELSDEKGKISRFEIPQYHYRLEGETGEDEYDKLMKKEGARRRRSTRGRKTRKSRARKLRRTSRVR